MRIFDHTTLTDGEIRNIYNRVLSIGDDTARSLAESIGRDRRPIQTLYVDIDQFNAMAGQGEDGYLILITKPLPLFVRVLFDRLFQDPAVMPWISDGDGKTTNPTYELPFAADPVNFEKREMWQIELSPERGFASGTLADIALSFIVLHEFGHVLAGHADGVEHYHGRQFFQEFTDLEPTVARNQDRDRAWEYDADAIASTFLMQYVEELVKDVNDNPRTASLFEGSADRVATALALSVVTLFVLFCYLRGVRYNLSLADAHPHPMARMYYVKDMLFAAAQARFQFDEDLFHDILDERLEEVIEVLERLNLFDGAAFTDAYIDELNAEVDRLRELQEHYRPSCERWTWISWS